MLKNNKFIAHKNIGKPIKKFNVNVKFIEDLTNKKKEPEQL